MADKNEHAVHLGRLGGKAKTNKKKEAAKNNGKLGGRPGTEISQERVLSSS